MHDSIFVDTSFVIALINEKDQYHDQAEALSYRFENSSLITTDAVLLEIGNALAKDFRREAIAVIKTLRLREIQRQGLGLDGLHIVCGDAGSRGNRSPDL